ncbi:MAG: 2-hydroxy-3-keto-5-methylthiopentenyl-1-phosphate phosphatase, partial [Ignavibacteria bacterium]|nr:2-hydroxy-3-keto-5-methylthiopentenyl-1-phosphate phosphatase [Ignavibacteria bacterium]
MTKKRFKIFLDFDGTITKNDVGEEIFKKFLAEDVVNKIVEDLLTDKISARECWESLCDSVRALDKIEFDNL